MSSPCCTLSSRTYCTGSIYCYVSVELCVRETVGGTRGAPPRDGDGYRENFPSYIGTKRSLIIIACNERRACISTGGRASKVFERFFESRAHVYIYIRQRGGGGGGQLSRVQRHRAPYNIHYLLVPRVDRRWSVGASVKLATANRRRYRSDGFIFRLIYIYIYLRDEKCAHETIHERLACTCYKYRFPREICRPSADRRTIERDLKKNDHNNNTKTGIAKKENRTANRSDRPWPCSPSSRLRLLSCGAENNNKKNNNNKKIVILIAKKKIYALRISFACRK